MLPPHFNLKQTILYIPATNNSTFKPDYKVKEFTEHTLLYPNSRYSPTISSRSEMDQITLMEDDQSLVKSRPKRSILNLYLVIKCGTYCNPLHYKGYGCYCGFLGSGTPVDGIDSCCKEHDWCYGAANCLGLSTYFVHYYWKCYEGIPYCTFNRENSCAQKLCECDIALASCLRQYPCPRMKEAIMYGLSKLPARNVLLKSNYATALSKKVKKMNKYSTQVAVKDERVDKELARTIERITNIKAKEYKKKPQKPPFAKNLFLGIFDTDVLAYPEALDKNMVDVLEKDIAPIKDFFENVDDKREEHITKNYLSNLSKLKLIGLQAPNFNGGRELTLTESCRYLEEMAQNTRRIGIVDSEMLGVQMLIKHGSENHKRYINQLVNGESLVSFCASEMNTDSNSHLFQTKAVLSSDKKTWIINGKKKLIINGGTADIFIVFAEAEKINKTGLGSNVVKAFIVERGFGGITSTPCEVTGLDQTDISDVTFKNTPVPAENLIGEIENDSKIISGILNEYRISKGALLTTLLRKGLNSFIEHCIQIDGGNKGIVNTDAVQAKIGELSVALYAIESATYMSAGLLDQYENQDCELEAAIVKLISTKYCRKAISSIMDFLGSTTFLKDNWCNQLHHDSLGHALLHEPVDSLRLTIALLGLQHAGMALADMVKALRNPFFNAGTVFKRIWTQKRNTEDNPKLTLKLYEHLHPSCMTSAQFLEYSVLRLQFATETLLSRFGPEIINKHVELGRLAECAADIYVTTAVLARASRSYCIGLRHANIEVEMATAFAVNAKERVKHNVNKIWHGAYNTADEKHLKTGKYAVKQKEYFAAHPLARNY
ncbi:hypothetical protein Trydic_g8982 [Trypoxylus dichotomus]